GDRKVWKDRSQFGCAQSRPDKSVRSFLASHADARHAVHPVLVSSRSDAFQLPILGFAQDVPIGIGASKEGSPLAGWLARARGAVNHFSSRTRNSDGGIRLKGGGHHLLRVLQHAWTVRG